MSKPVARKIPSDGCEVLVDGESCYPHEGEWVEMIVSETVGELRARVQMSGLRARIDAIRGESDEGARYNALMDEHYRAIIGCLSERVFAWNWTDLRGRPLPPPTDEAGKPLGLERLRPGELYWLMSASIPRETEDERKNG